MSRGFEELGLDRRASDTKDFTDFIQPVAGDGDAAVDENVLRFLIDSAALCHVPCLWGRSARREAPNRAPLIIEILDPIEQHYSALQYAD
jgi:hypothetical protein